MLIDKAFDFRLDTPANKDPDKYSATLRSYHEFLWSKALPSGQLFGLTSSVSGEYLFHESNLGEFSLSSDAITNSFIFSKRLRQIIDQISASEKEEILEPLYNIGGFIIFPARKRQNKMTINGARGFSAKIEDRFDLTLECIRRYYVSKESPLYEVLNRYDDFFSLFENFENYVKFFLLEDLIETRSGEIKFFLPFDDSFPTRPLPTTLEEYRIYISNVAVFSELRGERMERYSRL